LLQFIASCITRHRKTAFGAFLKAIMNQWRNLFLASMILLLASPSFAQNSRQTAPAIAIPSYPDTPRGLEKLLGEMMKLTKEHDIQTLAAYVKSLALPSPDGWFKSAFGDDQGPRYAVASAQSRSGIETAIPAILTDLLKVKRTKIMAHRFESSCDNAATAKEYPLLWQRQAPVPLYDARVSDGATEMVWQYFAYVDGGFRYIGNLSAFPPDLPKRPIAPQGQQSTAQAPE
jgi:hypothetical protein